MNLPTAIKKFFALEGTEQKLLIRGMIVYCYAITAINILPVRYYSSLLNTNEKNNTNIDLVSRRKVIRTVIRIKRHFPLHSSCLLLSIISLHLSKLMGINCRIRYALRINPKHAMVAHSYVVFDDGLSLFRNNKYRDVC